MSRLGHNSHAHAGRGNRCASAYQISASAAGVPVNLVVTTTIGHARLGLDLIAPSEHWEVRLGLRRPAEPTRIFRYDDSGGESYPSLHERRQRGVWRHLAAAIAQQEPLSYSLRDLAEDIAWLRDAA
jgi:hypothetical protein